MSKPPHQSPTPLTNTLLFKLILLTFSCCIFYFLGIYRISNQTLQTPFLDSSLCPKVHLAPTPSSSLDFHPHHTYPAPPDRHNTFPFCDNNFTDYCPCHDPSREGQFDMEKKFHKERHCPQKEEVVRCLVPKPAGYRTPFQWPKSRDFAWFSNVPFTKLVSIKKEQNWVRLEGDRLIFPGGGTTFRSGVKEYVDQIKKMVPLKSGNVRTVLDVGCGVASFGASLMDYNILTMSIAPRDTHEAQVQFALERGLPAMLGILSIHRLPYPSRSFDMAHCSRCLVPWTDYGGLYLMEIDRVLRPGGYWVISGPPINWKTYKGSHKDAKEMEKDYATLEDLARQLCWKKIAERNQIAVWKKSSNHIQCIKNSNVQVSRHFCAATDPDTGWYTKMDSCITPLPKVKHIKDISGGILEKWPKRLNAVPPRIRNKDIGRSGRYINQDNQLWKRRVTHYEKYLKPLTEGKYRNIMDMNAGLGGFAAALSTYQVWVMNVIPYDANNTLGIIYERGLIGTYMNWCEAFSTYPRTYDLIHADRIFSMYMNKCDIIDILFEMLRILRPHGAIIIRDHIDTLVKVKGIIEKMRWSSNIQHSERGHSNSDKILIVDNSNN